MAELPVTPPRPNGLTRTESSSPLPRTLALTEGTANRTSPRVNRSPAGSSIPQAFLLPSGTPDYLRLILTSKVYEVVNETPLQLATTLSNRLECKILLKREDLLPVFSFKLRGAYNKMAHLDPATRWKGVVACSAGNHAQGVAYSARKLKIPATIVMPKGTPAIKHQNVSRLGSTVVLCGDDFDAAKEECRRLEKLHGLVNIPPFDDPYVIAGQGTIGMEILRQTNLDELEAIFCCVGGGGLIAGIGVYIKRVAPHVKIIGVEAADASAMYQSLGRHERVVLKEVGLFADGAAVKVVGEETFRLGKEVVDEVVLVSTDEICAAIKDVFEDTRTVLEPAGALAVAGVKNWVKENPDTDPNRALVAVTSGANMDFDRLRFVTDRAALGENKEALLAVKIPEQIGSYDGLIQAVLPHDVTEFSYRGEQNSNTAKILMGIRVSGQSRDQEIAALRDRLAEQQMTFLDISRNELAKSHIRYFVGGRSRVINERLYMFQFPERPGALAKFLSTLKRIKINITAFHYRNLGGDLGKVLAGMQCEDSGIEELEKALHALGYPWNDETDNDMVEMFLKDD